ncbi:Histidine kinase-, DNA gyrase B-, and HSP90-like ATPase [compost metagenome]
MFYNLIDNSLYWIGQRQIRSKNDKFFELTDKDYIKIDKVDEHTILFSDTGTGVFPKYEHILFHSLTSGKDTHGRGMGLYIVKKLLNSFGADIELLPEKNQFGHRYIFALYLQNEDRNFEGEEKNGS